MVIDSLPMADQDESMNTRGRRRGSRIGVGAMAALCAVVLVVTSLSGCRGYYAVVVPRNPFLGEWHAEFAVTGGRISYEYEFESDGSYRYVRVSATGAGSLRVEIEGTYDYDHDTLTLTPYASSIARSQFEYEFIGDELQLESEIDTGVTVTLTYHRHS